MLPICGRPMIELLLERLSKAKSLDHIIVATSEREENNALSDLVRNAGFQVFRGSEKDVLDRYYQCARQARADVVVRITADCPLIDADIVDRVIREFHRAGVDYASNVNPPTYPDGLDTEVFTFKILEKAHTNAVSAFDREHVTPFIRNSSETSSINITNDIDLSEARWTVDEPEDFELISNIFEHFSPDVIFSSNKVLKLAERQPELFQINESLKRNEGSQMNSGQKLWRRAKRVIPGGGMLLSKRPEMFLPDQWPTYFSRTEGCSVWDLDGKHYYDLSLMGVGTNVLGYCCPAVDEAVKSVISSGNLSTLNCPEEVFLAERLIQIHPWAEMARFARSGGEANAVAVRIARAASGKDRVAICGYHGWHDWYLAANLSGEQLDGHLLPGLDPAGVPRGLRETVVPFRYNQIEEFRSVIERYPDIGVIKMEVARNHEPIEGFLEEIRATATQNNIVLIFDECSSGFRQCFGGLHKKFDVEPDMAVFGKTLGNGYAITAVIGKREVMECAQLSFISSTFWTERIGPSAAIATLAEMEKTRSWDHVTRVGQQLKSSWAELSKAHELPIEQWGAPGLQGFSFTIEPNLYKTLATQQMLERGFLANNTVYVSLSHTPEIVDAYLTALDETFGFLSECYRNKNAEQYLKGPVSYAGFKRLN